jgi:capsular exopolysaccharide synthesis family protein
MLDEMQRLKSILLQEREKRRAGSLFAITSTSPKEGASFVAFHLAVSLAKDPQTRVLLVDADFRRPSLHPLFENANAAGFSDTLTAGVDPRDVLRRTSMPQLAFMPLGTPVADPGQCLRSDQLDRLLKRFKSNFNFVIFDTPPVSRFPECLIMGPKVDQVILVVRAHRTRRQAVEHAKEEIKKYGGRLLGVVLNRRRFYVPSFLYRHL